jgi:hypothetical protein
MINANSNAGIPVQSKNSLMQAQALRLLQTAANNKATLSPDVLQNLYRQAARNGGLDPNSAVMQQIKYLIMLQQQQQQGQKQTGIINGNNDATNPNAEAISQAALLQQRQAQASVALAMNSSQTGNGGNVPVPVRSQSVKVWQGNIVWQQGNGSPMCRSQGDDVRKRLKRECLTAKLAVDASPVNVFSNTDLNTAGWPTGKSNLPQRSYITNQDHIDLRISGTAIMSVQDLQEFAKTNKTPCVSFNPSSPSDPVNMARYQSMASSLSAKGTVSVVIYHMVKELSWP